jgi:hypothetical protein
MVAQPTPVPPAHESGSTSLEIAQRQGEAHDTWHGPEPVAPPVLTSLAPSPFPAGVPTVLTINGSGFVSPTIIRWKVTGAPGDGAVIAAVPVSATQIRTSGSGIVFNAGSIDIKVQNGAGGAFSNVLALPVT